MTEDNTASDIDVNLGYSQYDADPDIEWILQVENFTNEAHLDAVSMIFGGLGPWSGSLWSYNFTWDQQTNFETDHGTVALSATVRACPAITAASTTGSSKSVTFSAEANKTYYVYKSTQASGAFNGASGGRYLYLMTVTTNGAGVGSFTDNEPLESWYVVLPANSTTGAIDGCHSEEAAPTAVTMAGFGATAQNAVPSVALEWQTLNELNLLGFNVYRSDAADGVKVKLNGGMIPAQHAGQLLGGSYSYEDTGVQPGDIWFYWVEGVVQSGPPEWLGPQSANVLFRMMLPLINR